jgi:hypothetical protein
LVEIVRRTGLEGLVRVGGLVGEVVGDLKEEARTRGRGGVLKRERVKKGRSLKGGVLGQLESQGKLHFTKK